MQKRRAVQSDVDKRRLHTGQHPLHLAQIHITHQAARGETTWHGIACRAVSIATEAGAVLRAAPERIAPIGTSEYPLPARRPANSRLCVDLVERRFGIVCPDWRVHFDRTVTEIIRGSNA
jgi:dTDP-4-dehydrorhamnose reductase